MASTFTNCILFIFPFHSSSQYNLSWINSSLEQTNGMAYIDKRIEENRTTTVSLIGCPHSITLSSFILVSSPEGRISPINLYTLPQTTHWNTFAHNTHEHTKPRPDIWTFTCIILNLNPKSHFKCILSADYYSWRIRHRTAHPSLFFFHSFYRYLFHRRVFFSFFLGTPSSFHF